MKTINWFACTALAGALAFVIGCGSPAGNLNDRFKGTKFTITKCSNKLACEGRAEQDLGCNMVGWTLEFIADVNSTGTASKGSLGNNHGSTELGWTPRVEKLPNGNTESYLDITGLPMGDGHWLVDHFRRWPSGKTDELELISTWVDSDGCRHTVTIVADLVK